MGCQLWTSPVTGYRRTGTRVREIRAMFETGITVRSIYEPLKACFANADARETAQLLDPRGFDGVGVKDTEKGAITCFGLADVLRKGGIVQDHAETIVV